MKTLAFEYLIKELDKISGKSLLTPLRAIKILFFVCMAECHGKKNESTLLDVFDDFRAYPYGHLEENIFKILVNQSDEKLKYYKIQDNILIPNDCVCNLNQEVDLAVREKIDLGIKKLLEHNSKFLDYSGTDLIDLSHSYFSWADANRKKEEQGHVVKIEKDTMIMEDKIYRVSKLWNMMF